jgi:uncharacterized protein involved in outer membrane biogenesis
MRKVLKWGLVAFGVLIAVTALVVILAYRQVSSTDNSRLRAWIGSQVRGLVQTYLKPQIEFEDLQYVYPRTVYVNKLRLVSPDPDKAGGTIDILKVAKVTMDLSEIPKEGQPIRIDQLILDHPSVQLVVPVSNDAGMLVGFSDFVRQAALTPQTQPKEVRLSEVLQITLLQLIEGEVAYQTRAGGVQTLRLDGINSKMDIQKGQAGWYGLVANLERKGILKLEAAGRLNLDNPVLELTALSMDMKLGREQDSYLPPQLQSLMRDYQVTGALSMKLSGTMPFAAPLESKLSVTASVRDAHFVAGAYRGQADSIDLAMEMAEQKLSFTKLLAHMLGGEVEMSGTVDMRGDHQGKLALKVRDIRIEDTLRAIESGSKPKYKGLLSGDVTLDCPLGKVLTEARGGGTAHLRKADLGSAPVVAQVLTKLASAFGNASANRGQDSDEGDFGFTFVGNRAHFTTIDLRTPSYSIHGDGEVYFNENLDLMLASGLMEGNPSVVGKLGNILGKTADKLVRHHVGGTISDPIVTVVLAQGVPQLFKMPRLPHLIP